MKKFEAVEEYLSRSDQIFELKSFLLFLSDDEALDQMNALSNSTITDKLKDFLKDYFPAPTHRETVGTCDAVMGGIMSRKKGLGSRRATVIDDVMRGLREKIDQLIACSMVSWRRPKSIWRAFISTKHVLKCTPKVLLWFHHLLLYKNKSGLCHIDLKDFSVSRVKRTYCALEI